MLSVRRGARLTDPGGRAVSAGRVWVVVLTAPDGRQMLSSASLMFWWEASHEASVWRRIPVLGPRGTWGADVRAVSPLGAARTTAGPSIHAEPENRTT